MSDDFNPDSKDATFARIISRLDNQDLLSSAWRTEFLTLLKATKEAVDKTNGRVTALEQEKWMNRGVVAGISVAATAFWHWFTRPR